MKQATNVSTEEKLALNKKEKKEQKERCGGVVGDETKTNANTCGDKPKAEDKEDLKTQFQKIRE